MIRMLSSVPGRFLCQGRFHGFLNLRCSLFFVYVCFTQGQDGEDRTSDRTVQNFMSCRRRHCEITLTKSSAQQELLRPNLAF